MICLLVHCYYYTLYLPPPPILYHRHRIHRPRKRPKIIEVVYQQLTQLGRTDSAVGKPLIYYCENSSSYSGRGAWSIYLMSMFYTGCCLPSDLPSLPVREGQPCPTLFVCFAKAPQENRLFICLEKLISCNLNVKRL